jgi:hypothetical protein
MAVDAVEKSKMFHAYHRTQRTFFGLTVLSGLPIVRQVRIVHKKHAKQPALVFRMVLILEAPISYDSTLGAHLPCCRRD